MIHQTRCDGRKAPSSAALVVCGLIVANIFHTGAASAHDLTGEIGLQAGLIHPLTGLDHLLAMVAVGMVSVMLGGSAIWQVPGMFLAAMIVGAVAGYNNWHLRHVEIGIALSVLLLGVAVILPELKVWRRVVFGCVAVFGICHGYAHGIELPRAAAPLAFSFGFLLTSLFLHVCGLFIAEVTSGAVWRVGIRQAIGVAMAMAGAWFLSAAALAA